MVLKHENSDEVALMYCMPTNNIFINQNVTTLRRVEEEVLLLRLGCLEFFDLLFFKFNFGN